MTAAETEVAIFGTPGRSNRFDRTRIGLEPGRAQVVPSDPTLAAAVERYRALGEGIVPIPLRAQQQEAPQ